MVKKQSTKKKLPITEQSNLKPDQKNKGGRPSLKKQKDMEKQLREYFVAGLTASGTALITKINRKTVSAYFKEWTEEIIDDNDFIFQQQEAKARLAAELDKRILIYINQISRLQKKLEKEQKPVWESLLTNANSQLAKLSIDKAGVLMTPTLDIQITNILKDKYGIDIKKISERPNDNRR